MGNKQKLIDMIDKAQGGLDSYLGYFNDYYMAYKALLDKQAVKYLELKGKSNIPFYYIMNKLSRIRADFVEAYFTNKQFAKINEKPTLKKGNYYNPVLGNFIPFLDTKINHEAIKALQNAVDYYTIDDENCDLFEELSKAFEDLFIYGTVALKVWWDNGIKVEAIEIKDIMYDSQAKTSKDNKYKVHNITLTPNEIKAYQEKGIFDINVDLEKIAPGYKNNKYKRIKLQEVYETKDDEVFVSTIFNRDIVLRENKKIEFIDPLTIGKIKNQKVNPNGDDSAVRTYGDSIIAPLMPIQREITILRNQQLDIVDRQLNPRYLTNDNNLNPFDFTNQKQLIIKGDPNKIKELNMPNIKDSIFNVDRLSVEGQEAIGVTDYNSGNSNNKQLNNTATGISILTSESNKILAHYIRCCNETLIKPLFRKITELVWAYGDAKFFYGINREQKIEYRVGVDVGLGATNKEQQLNSKTTAYQGMLQLAQLTGKEQEIQKAEKFYYKEILPLLGVENYEEYYKDGINNITEQPTQITGE